MGPAAARLQAAADGAALVVVQETATPLYIVQEALLLGLQLLDTYL